MPQNVITNKNAKGGYITINVGSGGAFFLNNSDTTKGSNAAGETVQSLNIVSITTSCGNGTFYTIKRGANTVLVIGGEHEMDLNDGRLIDNVGGEPQANVVVTKTGTGPSSCIIKMHKRSAITGGSQY